MIELDTKKESLDIDTYACAVKIKTKYFQDLINFGHLPREIYRHVHFFIKTESGNVHGYIESLVYRASPIPVDGLEILLRLTFSCPKEDTMNLMKDFLITLYSCTFTSEIKEDGDS